MKGFALFVLIFVLSVLIPVISLERMETRRLQKVAMQYRTVVVAADSEHLTTVVRSALTRNLDSCGFRIVVTEAEADLVVTIAADGSDRFRIKAKLKQDPKDPVYDGDWSMVSQSDATAMLSGFPHVLAGILEDRGDMLAKLKGKE